MDEIWCIRDEDIAFARGCLKDTLKAGADAVRITLYKSIMDLVSLRNGTPEKVSRSADRHITFCIFADGRYGTFSTNRISEGEMKAFIQEAVKTVRMLAPDPFRTLPDPSRICREAVTGREMDLYDDEYASMTPSRRMDLAREASFFSKAVPKGYKVISEEMEYSDSLSDVMLFDSQGLEARSTDTSFDLGCEYTIEDKDGHKLSGYWWDSSPRLKDVDIKGVCPRALERAAACIGASSIPTGKYTMVVESEVASKLLNPLLTALGGSSLQQNNSFLCDSLGRQIFSKGLTVKDLPRTPGKNGARLCDSEGVSAYNCTVIENGVVKRYFLNTYMAGKMGMEPTIEDCMRAVVSPWWSFPGTPSHIGLQQIKDACGEGILVTGFNGGNCNSATGDFSYGIEGFYFKGGESRPVHGMVATGNMITLWNNLLAAGDDSRPCASKVVPSLAFANVDFSA